MNRRRFLQAISAGVAVTAGGIELLQLAIPKRTFFLPPVGGWRQAICSFGPGKLYAGGVLTGEVSNLDLDFHSPGLQIPIANIPQASARTLSGKWSLTRRVSSDEAWPT